jgi:hypothetical protein
MFDTPVLFLVFNRPDATRKALKRIREIQPAKLFIAADGPRDIPGEKEKCEEVRNMILKGIDWDCEVKTLFRDVNLGCGPAVSSGITWFFYNVEEGIILEDDVLPSLSFFGFAKELLNLYRNDESVWHIGGNSYNPYKMEATYYFSAYPHIWGWATWRRAWNSYRFRLDDIDREILFANIDQFFLTNAEKKFWKHFFDDHLQIADPITWDYQWTFRMWYNKGLAILPRTNLITNIGFDEEATHTRNIKSWLGQLKSYEIESPKRKEPVNQNKKADLFTSRKVFSIQSPGRKLRRFLSNIKQAVTRKLK